MSDTSHQPRLFSTSEGGAAVVWRDPPSDRRRVLSSEVLEVLRARPGRWAVVRVYTTETAVKRGRSLKRPVDIEVRAVVEPPGSVLYARAVPTRS